MSSLPPLAILSFTNDEIILKSYTRLQLDLTLSGQTGLFISIFESSQEQVNFYLVFHTISLFLGVFLLLDSGS